MSGLKRSTVVIDPEQRARHEAAARLRVLANGIEQTRHAIRQMLDELPADILEELSDVASAARAFVEAENAAWDMNRPSEELRRIVETGEKTLDRGGYLVGRLAGIRSLVRQRKKAAQDQVSTLRALLEAHAASLDEWTPDVARDRRRDIAEMARLAGQGEFRRFQEAAKRFQADLEAGVRKARAVRESEMRARAVGAVQMKRLQARLKGAQDAVRAAVGDLSRDVLDLSPDARDKALLFLSRTGPPWVEGRSSAELARAAAACEALIQDGAEALQAVEAARAAGREAARELAGEIETLRAEVHTHRDLLDRWSPGAGDRHLRDLDDLARRADEGEIQGVRDAAATLREALRDEVSRALAREEQDQDRRHVVDALVAASRELGWSVSGGPTLEDPARPDSPIVLEVNTFQHGFVTFRVTLDTILADSALPLEPGQYCIREFDLLSESLAEMGVTTRFEMVPGHDPDQGRIEKGARDLPGTGRTTGHRPRTRAR